MSSLTEIEMFYLVKVFNLTFGNAQVVGDRSFENLFAYHGIDIREDRFKKNGYSMDMQFKTFMEVESNWVVAPTLNMLLKKYNDSCVLNLRRVDHNLYFECQKIVNRIGGLKNRESKPSTLGTQFPKGTSATPLVETEKNSTNQQKTYNLSHNDETNCNTKISNSTKSKSIKTNVKNNNMDTFLKQEFETINLHQLPIEPKVAEIIEKRIEEIAITLLEGAYLSSIIMCGSTLEGVLIGIAQKSPKKFNRAKSSPKTKEGKVKRFSDWKLKELIDTASELRLLAPEVKDYSITLRDYRNYIHPNEQLISQFHPTENSAKICFQVLKAALANLSEKNLNNCSS